MSATNLDNSPSACPVDSLSRFIDTLQCHAAEQSSVAVGILMRMQGSDHSDLPSPLGTKPETEPGLMEQLDRLVNVIQCNGEKLNQISQLIS